MIQVNQYQKFQGATVICKEKEKNRCDGKEGGCDGGKERRQVQFEEYAELATLSTLFLFVSVSNQVFARQ